MLFNKFTVGGLLAATAGANAIPALVAPGLTVSAQHQVENGMITVYGSTHEKEQTIPAIQERDDVCNAPNNDCGSGHYTNPAACGNLISVLNSDRTGIFKNGDRAICWNSESNRCCVSWNFPLYVNRAGALVPTVKKIMEACTHTVNEISGRRWGDDIGGKCPVICLSNRPDGCR